MKYQFELRKRSDQTRTIKEVEQAFRENMRTFGYKTTKSMQDEMFYSNSWSIASDTAWRLGCQGIFGLREEGDTITFIFDITNQR
jgi:hypothetical protein